MSNLSLDSPNLGAAEKKYLSRAIDTNFVSIVGPFVPHFERSFAEWLGDGYAVSVQSGTAALHIALHELGIGPGDEVIVPALTFIASINPVLYVGATPVIVDVDPETWTIDPKEIQKALTPKTKAIIPVHLYGNPCEMAAITKIAGDARIHVIEDATESLGARYRGKPTGLYGEIGCFSFNGNKLITTGGGGMIITKSADRARHIKFLVNQGRDESKGYYHPEMGFNYRMTNIEAALGLAQLKKARRFLAKKIQFRKIYEEALSGLPGLQFQKATPGSKGSWWLTCAKIKNVHIGDFQKALRERSIPTRRIFVPAGEMPYLRKFTKSCRHALEIYERGICLPGSTLNAGKSVQKAAAIIRKALNG